MDGHKYILNEYGSNADNYFNDFEMLRSKIDGTKLKMKLADAVDKRNLCVMEDGVVTAGFLCDEVIAELKKQEGMDQVSCIVYVDANYKRSHLNTHETFVVISGKAVSLDKILLLSEKRRLVDNTEAPYFYLYYSSNTETAEERKRKTRLLEAQ